jgi:DNA-binding IclR family transcriptional regulator
MARSSAAVLRAAAILGFMAEHPGQAFTMAELVRALKLSQSTSHSLLSALVKVGYLFRTTERTYVMGPALIAIGKQAAEHYSPLKIAHPEMRKLADRFDVVCSATFRTGNDTVVKDRAASASKIRVNTEIAVPLKIRGPLASIYLAWSLEEIDPWLSSIAQKLRERERQVVEQGIAFIHKHGFIAYLKNPNGPGMGTAPEKMFEGELAELPFTLATTIERRRNYNLSSLAAPVFDASGKVDFILVLRGFDEPVPGSTLFEIAEELKQACARISSFSGAKRATEWQSPF